MSGPTPPTGAAVVAAPVVLSAVLSSSETALFTLSGEWLAERESSVDPRRLLVTCLVGNNVVDAAIASVVTVVAVKPLPPGVAVTAAPLVASVVLVFGEIVPKSAASATPRRG